MYERGRDTENATLQHFSRSDDSFRFFFLLLALFSQLILFRSLGNFALHVEKSKSYFCSEFFLFNSRFSAFESEKTRSKSGGARTHKTCPVILHFSLIFIAISFLVALFSPTLWFFLRYMPRIENNNNYKKTHVKRKREAKQEKIKTRPKNRSSISHVWSIRGMYCAGAVEPFRPYRAVWCLTMFMCMAATAPHPFFYLHARPPLFLSNIRYSQHFFSHISIRYRGGLL